METLEPQLEELLGDAVALADVAKKARRHRKSLNGDNFYAEKFHSIALSLAEGEARLQQALNEYAPLLPYAKRIKGLVGNLVQPGTGSKTENLKELQFLVKSELRLAINSLAPNPVPRGEHVLPASVVAGTRGYLERIVQQANGCYEHQWYDACSVMIRKLVEILIIEAYESAGRAKDIKTTSGDFFLLKDLIDAALANSQWNLGRETKRALPSFKTLGDRSAHNRRYLAEKKDIDPVLPGLRVTVDELLHLARLK